MINFVKTKLSYEYSSKHMDTAEILASQSAAPVHHQPQITAEQAREQAILKRVMGLSQPQTTMQSITNFFNEKLEVVEEKQPINNGQNEVIRKIKSCSVCKVQKCNHIVREYLNNTNAPGGMSDMSIS